MLPLEIFNWLLFETFKALIFNTEWCDGLSLIVALVSIRINTHKLMSKNTRYWHYKKYSRDPELAKLEFDARAKKIGLWSEPYPIPPWEWRRK